MGFPPAEAFRQKALALAEQAKAVLARDGYHTHIVYGIRADGTGVVAQIATKGDPPGTAHARVRQVVDKLHLRAFVSINEVWSVATPEDGPLPRPGELQHHPEARSALGVFAAHPRGRWAWVTPFAKEHGQVIFGKREALRGDSLVGGLMDIIPLEAGGPPGGPR